MPEIREMLPGDYDQVAALWKAVDGLGWDEVADSRAGVEKYLARNPGTCFVAEAGGRVVGTVLCGHDGRRGYIYHLAVSPSARRRGVGRALAEGALASLRAAGIRKCHLFVFNANRAALAFWTALGWQVRDFVTLSRLVDQGG